MCEGQVVGTQGKGPPRCPTPALTDVRPMLRTLRGWGSAPPGSDVFPHLSLCCLEWCLQLWGG